MESFGVKAGVELPVGPEEKRARNILETSTQHTGERYASGLLWRFDDVMLPDNREAALKRFFAVERRPVAQKDYANRYVSSIEQYANLGHARLLNASELPRNPGRTWYLPHHGVENNGKLRIVFDASAKFRGTCLNDILLKGPDLIQSQFGILIKFRENAVAVSADIEKMFNQVLVTRQDRSALRFVWRRPGSAEPPKTYEMQVQVFGSVSSPTICNFVLLRAAKDSASEFPDAAARVQENFYVDNYLDSFDNENDACTVARDNFIQLK